MTDTPVDPIVDPNAAPAATWRDTLPDELKADATLGKYDSLEALARGHLETKRQLSGEKIPLPKDENDADGWNAAFKALGRPDTADDYKFDIPEGEARPLVDAFKPVAHELGLNQRQVTALDKFISEQSQAAIDAELAAGTASIETLKGEVGEAGWKEMEARARGAAKAFGVSDEQADKLDRIMGSADLVKLFDTIGKRMGEGRFLGGDPPNPLVESDPEKQMTDLQNDADFRTKLNNGDVEAKRKWDAVVKAVGAKKQQA